MWPSNEPTVLDATQLDDLNRRFAASDTKLGIELTPDFKPFTQRNDVFTRAFWDDTVRTTQTDGFFASYRDTFSTRKGKGFSRKDFALRNAAWSVSDMVSDRAQAAGIREGFQAPMQCNTEIARDALPIENAKAESDELKQVSRLFGADLVGITELDLRWHYSSRVDTRDFEPAANDLPNGMTHVIVMGHAMDADLVDTYPSALAGASTGLEYSHEAAIVTQMTAYIRNLGFEAIGSMNDTALVIPYAIKAGLGEYGRNQMLLTPEYGPRIRFSKIFTNMPLLADEPTPLGIKQYCDICKRCAEACPPKALPFGKPSAEQRNISNISGVIKWTANAEKCFGYWASMKTDCAICMRVCPFNRRYETAGDRLFRKLATSRWRRLALWWESRRGMAKRLGPDVWWNSLTGRNN